MLLDPAAINLNTGSFGPLPRVVFERVTALRQRLAEEPMDFLLRGAPPLLWQARERLAHFVGGDPRHLLFTANVTAAVNLVASSLSLSAPGEVLLTDHEYGAMHWCWERAAQRQGLTLRTFPLPILPSSPDEIVEDACAAMSERTRLLFFSHVLSPTGMVLPARRCAPRLGGAASSRWWTARTLPRSSHSISTRSAPITTGPIVTSGCWRRPAPASCTLPPMFSIA